MCFVFVNIKPKYWGTVTTKIRRCLSLRILGILGIWESGRFGNLPPNSVDTECIENQTETPCLRDANGNELL